MEPLESDSSDDVQITIPRWVYNRIAVLLIAAQGGAKVEDYIVAVLEGHARKLKLRATSPTAPWNHRCAGHSSVTYARQMN
jgi:hypothetical protein